MGRWFRVQLVGLTRWGWGVHATAENEAAQNRPEKLADIISLEGYCSSQEFNVGENGLLIFWWEYLHQSALPKKNHFLATKQRMGFNTGDCTPQPLHFALSTDWMWLAATIGGTKTPTPLEGKVDEATSRVQYGARHKHCGLHHTFLASCNTTDQLPDTYSRHAERTTRKTYGCKIPFPPFKLPINSQRHIPATMYIN
jgi:hypothetical protein